MLGSRIIYYQKFYEPIRPEQSASHCVTYTVVSLDEVDSTGLGIASPVGGSTVICLVEGRVVAPKDSEKKSATT